MADKQLRVYDLTDGSVDVFIDAWRHQIVPLRRQAGYEVVGAWVDRDANRFSWIVGWDEGSSFDDVESVYLQLREAADLDPDPAQFVTAMQLNLVAEVDAD